MATEEDTKSRFVFFSPHTEGCFPPDGKWPQNDVDILVVYSHPSGGGCPYRLLRH